MKKSELYLFYRCDDVIWEFVVECNMSMGSRFLSGRMGMAADRLPIGVMINEDWQQIARLQGARSSKYGQMLCIWYAVAIYLYFSVIFDYFCLSKI